MCTLYVSLIVMSCDHGNEHIDIKISKAYQMLGKEILFC